MECVYGFVKKMDIAHFSNSVPKFLACYFSVAQHIIIIGIYMHARKYPSL